MGEIKRPLEVRIKEHKPDHSQRRTLLQKKIHRTIHGSESQVQQTQRANAERMNATQLEYKELISKFLNSFT